jgi:hypothetical protein
LSGNREKEISVTTPTNNSGNRRTPVPVYGLEALRTVRLEIIAFRRELPRLLDEGHEGRVALVHGDEVHSLWDTFADAYQAGRLQFGMQPFLAQPIETRDLDYAFPEEFEPPTAS